MKNIYKLTFILLAGSFLFSSCDNWLTLEPEDGVIREEFWQTKEQVNSAVIGCYSSIMNGPVEKMFLWGELRADLVDNGVNINSAYSQIIDGEISAENTVVNWGSFYTTINNCNTVLRFASEVKEIDGTFTDKQLKAYEAEALTLRAMMYFYLVRSFKDVPFVTEASVSDDQNYSIGQTSGDVILDSLIADLKIAVINAPLSYPTTAENKSRITAWSARALLADIYLWKEQYTQCNALCDEIIASKKFNLIPTEKFYLEIADGGVVIDTVTVANEGDAETMFVNTYVLGNSIESLFEIPFNYLKNNPFYGLLGPNVNRLRPKSDVLEGGIFPDPMYLAASSASDIRGNGCSYRMNVVWKYVGTGRSSAVRASSNYTSPWIVYKYSDVLLMKAEALNQMGLKVTNDEELTQSYFAYAVDLLEQVRFADRKSVV